jgi:two-component sensor histidine kinase
MWGVARRLTLRQRVVATVAVAIIPALVALPYFIAAIHETREREVKDNAVRTSQLAALEMERIATGAQGILQTLAVAPAVRAADSAACARYLQAVADRLPQLAGLAVADPDGTVRCSEGLDLPEGGVAGEGWFRDASAGSSYVVGTYATRAGRTPYLPVALPIEVGGRTVAVAMAGIDLAWLGERLRERNLAQGSALAVADRDGMILAREPDSNRYVGTRISDQVMPQVHATLPGSVEVRSSDGERRILGYQPPAWTGTGLFIGASFGEEEAFRPILASTLRTLALAVAGALAACAIAWTVGDRLFRQPIRRILATITSWRQGDEAARTGIVASGNDELAELAESIDRYMDEVAAARAERARAEEHRVLLLHEMNHRIKNILAAVQAVANQTFKDRASPESLAAFGSRLQAMAATQNLLVHENWESVDLRSALEAVLAPFDHDRRLVGLAGPPLRISARAALALSMAVHELCTNAAKYGALSVPEGRVEMRWRLAEAGTRFHLEWTEAGGPPVRPPEHTGFGSQLIRVALASDLAGKVELDFPATGVRFSVDADAARVLADPAHPAGVEDCQRKRQSGRAQGSGLAPTT